MSVRLIQRTVSGGFGEVASWVSLCVVHDEIVHESKEQLYFSVFFAAEAL